MASGIAVRLYKAGFRRILMLEREKPLAVRRLVCFSEAVYDGSCRVEDVQARLLSQLSGIEECFEKGVVAVLVDPVWESLRVLRPEVVIDAILAKKNLGTTKNEAPLVIGIGPGFVAGDDVHLVVESMRGHHLGRVISSGSALPDTGIPGEIAGYTSARILRAPGWSNSTRFPIRYSMSDIRRDGLSRVLPGSRFATTHPMFVGHRLASICN